MTNKIPMQTISDSILEHLDKIENHSQKINYLLEQKEAQPDNLSLMYLLAETYLYTESTDEAFSVLQEAINQIRLANEIDKNIAIPIYLFLAQLLISRGDFYTALSELSFVYEIFSDHFELSRMYAYLNLQTGNTEQACKIYKRLWNSEAELFEAQDLLCYCQALRSEGNANSSLKMTGHFEQRFGLQYSLGLLQSGAYETEGRFFESYLSAVQDMDWSRLTGSISHEQLQNNQFRMKSAALDLLPKSEHDKFQTLYKIIQSYMDENFTSVPLNLLDSYSYELLYWQYIKSVYTLKCRLDDSESIDRYIQLEPFCSFFPGYYYHLWQAMKSGDSSYSFRRVRSILEKTIMLTADSIFCTRTRIELCQLLGLSETNADKLLIPQEMEQIVILINMDNVLTEIDKLMDFLELPYTLYTATAIEILWKLCANDRCTDYIYNCSLRYTPNIQKLVKMML